MKKVECIVDTGSQIVAMSKSFCHDLALTYDPTIRLNMQSAKGDVDQSLGLARNIPTKIGEITLTCKSVLLNLWHTIFS